MKWWLSIALVAMLSGCASQVRRAELPPAQVEAAMAAQAARESELRAAGDWSLAGRVAVSNGRDGGSGRMDWQQQGERYTVSLSAPVTRQSWQLTGDARQARLDGVEGGPRMGPDAGALLREATGWDIPVVALRDWVRGVRAAAAGPADIRFGADALPARIEQGGWVIEYVWPAQPATPALPARIDARRGEARVKLIVDRWDGP